MITLVVDVHEAAFDLRHPLDLALEALGDVVRLTHRHALGQDDVDLYDEVAAEVERAHCVDHEDLGVVVEAHPRNLGEELRPRRVAGQHLDLRCNTERALGVSVCVRAVCLNHYLHCSLAAMSPRNLYEN